MTKIIQFPNPHKPSPTPDEDGVLKVPGLCCPECTDAEDDELYEGDGEYFVAMDADPLGHLTIVGLVCPLCQFFIEIKNGQLVNVIGVRGPADNDS